VPVLSSLVAEDRRGRVMPGSSKPLMRAERSFCRVGSGLRCGGLRSDFDAPRRLDLLELLDFCARRTAVPLDCLSSRCCSSCRVDAAGSYLHDRGTSVGDMCNTATPTMRRGNALPTEITCSGNYEPLSSTRAQLGTEASHAASPTSAVENPGFNIRRLVPS
jgi:hypothetical protein